MENIIQLSQFTPPEITLSNNAIIVKNQLLEQIASIDEIKSSSEATNAAKILKEAKAMCREVESVRKEITAPILDIQRDIMAKAKEFNSDIDVQIKRIAGVLGVYEKEQREISAQKKREEEAKLRAEQERIRKAAEEKQRLENEAAQRKIAEAKAKQDKEAEIQARLQSQAKKTEIEAEAKKNMEMAKAEKKVAIAISAPAKTVKLRDEWKFEVTDIKELYMWYPELIDLCPNNAAIREQIKTNKKIPGLRIWNAPRAI